MLATREIEIYDLEELGFCGGRLCASKKINGIRLKLESVMKETAWKATVGDSAWPFLIRTREQVVALISAMQAE